MSNQTPARVDNISSRIRTIRGKKIILDFDLAEIYDVPTKALNQAVKRNLTRFPDEVAIIEVLRRVMDILDPPPPPPEPPPREIGFHVGMAEQKSKAKRKKKT